MIEKGWANEVEKNVLSTYNLQTTSYFNGFYRLAMKIVDSFYS